MFQLIETALDLWGGRKTQLVSQTLESISHCLQHRRRVIRPLAPTLCWFASLFIALLCLEPGMGDGNRIIWVGSSTQLFPAEQQPASSSDSAAFFASVVWCGLADRLLRRVSCEWGCFREICWWNCEQESGQSRAPQMGYSAALCQLQMPKDSLDLAFWLTLSALGINVSSGKSGTNKFMKKYN